MKNCKAKKVAPQNVFAELGFSREESRVLALKAQLAGMIVRTVKERGLTQKNLGALWDVPQPRVSEILTGKLSVVSIDRLVEFLGALGIEVIVRAKPRGHGPTRRAV